MKYVAMALFLLIALPVKAEEMRVPVNCGPTQDVLDVVKGKYQEELIFLSQGISQGNGSALYNSLWINITTQTWSFLVVNKDSGKTCIFSSGKTFQFFEPGESI